MDTPRPRGRPRSQKLGPKFAAHLLDVRAERDRLHREAQAADDRLAMTLRHARSQGATLDELARVLKVSRQRIHQLTR